ncbi:Beta-arrestin-1 [Clonorchis sinensis]|uniref:Beta-arrestin-1 n=1 Tax=Clonorchis sinensis TaxID=79923 RepID=A0A8T1MQH9_CLOSI|nr:Beta-arrestin-1 [Clonorchis sinensis]
MSLGPPDANLPFGGEHETVTRPSVTESMETGPGPTQKQGTRVFKKSSPNGKITTYLCKRDFIDSLTHCDPIEGVVLIDPEYVRDRKVFTHVLAAFRYGREDLDVLGLTFRKDLYLASTQVYPCVHGSAGENDGEQTLVNPPVIVATTTMRETKATPGRSFVSGSRTDDGIDAGPQRLTRLQERLMKKLGNNAFPFYFKLPPDAPASVMLQPGPNENGKPCGVDYELRTYVADGTDDKLQKRNSVRLAIRKLTYAPEEAAPQPSAVVVKDFLMSPGSLRLEVSLDKEKYYHGESIAVNVLVDNNSNKTVKKVKLSVRQYTELCLHNSNRYSCVVDELEAEESFPILPSQTGWCKVYRLRPLLSNNRHKRGLALDGKLKHEDTNLASSTIICNPQQKENLGMIVQYRVKVRLVLGFGASDVSLELPFTLTHPKPIVELEDNVLKIDELEDNPAASPDSFSPSSSPVAEPTANFPFIPDLSETEAANGSSSADLITLGGDMIGAYRPPTPPVRHIHTLYLLALHPATTNKREGKYCFISFCSGKLLTNW